MDRAQPIYTELLYQMRKREDLRSEDEIMLIALREWMARNYGLSGHHGYQWKELFLPHGTMLRIRHCGMYYFAQVEGDLLLADGKIVTPSGWAAEICGSSRNAWRDIYLRRNYLESWSRADAWRATAPRGVGIERRRHTRRRGD